MKKNHFFTAIVATIAVIFSLAGCKKDSKNLPANSQPKTATAANPKMVLFPGAGLVPADQVHYIEPGNYLTRRNGHIFKLQKGTDMVMQDFGEFKRPPIADPANNTQQPASHWSASLNSKAGGNIPAVGGNWVTWSQWTPTPATTSINSFSTTWTVPGNPTIPTDGQTIFIFNSLTDASGTDILQPVLQWGVNSTAGGGNYWSIVNVYYAPPLTVGAPGFYAYTTYIPVSPGTIIQGVMTLDYEQGDGSYVYTSAFTGYNNSLFLQEGVTPRGANVFFKDSYPFAPSIPQLNTASEAVEAYTGIGGAPSTIAADYPPDNFVAMKSIAITTNSTPSTLNWSLGNISNTIGQHATLVSNTNPAGEVDLWFHNPILPPVISYPTPDVLPDGFPVSINPTNTGGAPISYVISPTTLPAGVTFSNSTGSFGGSPTGVSAPVTYTVTATNSGGSGHTTVTISTVADVSFGITNNSGNGLSITFYRVDKSQTNISTVATAHSGTNTPLPVPPGVYNINWNPSGMPVNCIVTLSNGVSSPNAPGGSFTNVTVGTGQVTSLTAH